MTGERFRLDGPLPSGVTVLEASAGTGKTFAIAGLVARYVAAGTPLPQLLVVTFTRAATAELRDRVRRRLVETADALEAFLDGGVGSDDPVVALLAAGPRPDVAERHRRLATALTEFDAATIATIHGFCQHVLQGVGLAGDVERDPTFVEDDSDLVEAVVDDVLVRTFHRAPDGIPVTRRELLAVAAAVVGNPDAVIVPADAEDPTARWRIRLANAVRDEVARRKRDASQLSYDDVLTRLADTLSDPLRGPAARRRLRTRYRVALVDEFQDTDPIQWRILAEAFGTGSTLVLIGDPKQAIYTFRGADVHAYLAAARSVTPTTLATNWRSDGDLVAACNVLFDGATFGHPGIAYREVEAAPEHRSPRLRGAPSPAALQLRVLTRDGIRLLRNGRIQVDAARERVAADVAAQVVGLLSSGATVDGADGPAPVRPRDLAILARTNAEAALVQRTLRDAGVPAVINGVGSVFATPAATDWLRLLEALERPSSPVRARTAALTAFLGWSAQEVAATVEDESRLDPVHERLWRWAGTLRDRSVAALLAAITVEESLPARILACRDGERLLTDLEHVGELLHATAVAEEVGPAGLATWLRERVAEADDDIGAEERARRLESDAEAVQVLTIHRSKGLEFPVVLCPFLWSPGWTDRRVPVFHDRDTDEQRLVDVAGPGGEEFGDHQQLADREQRGEDLRLLYVALTRARHQVVVWWAPAHRADFSPLTRLLFCRSSDGRANMLAGSAQPPGDEQARERLDQLAARAGRHLSVDTVPVDVAVPTWSPPPPGDEPLGAATFGRDLDRAWRRTSYSALTAVAHDALVTSEPDEPVVTDEAALAGTVPAASDAPDLVEAALRAVPCPLGDLPAGTAFGTFVHGVLEHTDFAADDLGRELREHVRAQLARRPLDVDEDALVEGLRTVLDTPLGPLADDVALRGVDRRHRRDELGFELPLAGGTTPSGEVTVAAIGELLREELRPGDPLLGYADRLDDPAFTVDVRGYLNGSIDLVLRVGDRYLVVDHKTNRLAPPDEPLTAWHYRPEALAEAMARGHYPLQALLYTVALHRYLRWRLAGYDPAADLGGVLYLFVRGMCGPDVPRVAGQPCGVFAWAPPASLVVRLSDLLDRGRLP